MTQKEFDKFLEKNQQEVKKAVKEFEHHSKEFDKRIKKILLAL